MSYRNQEPPNAVQIELVEGCQLRCTMCGLNGIRGKENDYKLMEQGTLRSLLNQMKELKWNSRIEFAMHGEPSMHPNLADMVMWVKHTNPAWHLMLTSNGGGFLKSPGPASRIAHLFRLGLDTLALDDYQNVKIVPKIRAEMTLGTLPEEIKIYDYPSGGDDANPHTRVKFKRLIYVEDILHATSGTHSHINNHAGSGAPLNDNGVGKRCAKPFRELAVRWDGNVAVCCNDWRGVYHCGNVTAQCNGLAAVWNGAAMGAARAKLYHGQRDFGPCKGCDATSYRVGLLPDKFGKETLPKPNASVEFDVMTALEGQPYTQPVLREWEVAAAKPRTLPPAVKHTLQVQTAASARKAAAKKRAK